MCISRLIILLGIFKGGLIRKNNGLIFKKLGMLLVSNRITIDCLLNVRDLSISSVKRLKIIYLGSK